MFIDRQETVPPVKKFTALSVWKHHFTKKYTKREFFRVTYSQRQHYLVLVIWV